MAQQPYFKGIPKKKSLDGVLRADQKAKTEVIKKVVETAKPDVNPTGPVAKKYLTKDQQEKVAKRAPEVAKREALKNLTTNVTVETAYGNATIPYKGYRALDPDQQRALLKEMQAKIEAAEDAKRKPADVPARTANRYEETKPVDVDAETKRILGSLESTVLGANNPLYRAADKYVQDAKASNQDTGLLGMAKGLGLGIAESAIRPASSFEGSVGNMYDPDATAEERLGAIGNAALYVPSVLPVTRGAQSGFNAFRMLQKKSADFAKNARTALGVGAKTFVKEAVPFGERLLGAIDGPVVNDMVPAAVRQGIDFKAPRQADPASGVVTPPEPHFTAGYEPTGAAPTSFADQQRAAVRDVLGADDVSGIGLGFRQPIAKMPESRLESLSPQGRALESWAGSNLQKLLDNGVGSDLRTWDAVGKHYGAGAVPRNADDFNLWVNDLVRSVDDNDRSVSAMAESYGRGGDLNADLVALREARGKARLNTQLRGGTNMVALIPQGRGYNVSKNSAWVPLESIPMHLRRSVMDRVGSSETRFTSRANYQAWVDAGKPEGGVLRPRMADEYMMDSFGGDSTLDDFILNPPKEAMVPQWAISAEIKNLSNRYTEAGKAAAAMRKPVRPQDFDDAVKHYNLESSPAPVEVPVAPKPVEVKAPAIKPTTIGSNIEPGQPLQPQPATPKPMADMVPNEPVVTSAGDRPVTGISNAANLTDFEQGILSRAPEGQGRSVKEILETNSQRKDWDDIADRVNKGESYTADTAATVLLGKADYTARVKSAKDAIERAIVEGASDDTMRGLRRKLDDEIEAATEFAEKIQRGKSDWSDVGRTLATMLNYDTKQIESVLQEARIRKGAPLTQADIDFHTARVNDLTKALEESQAEIARLIKEHADNATKVAATRRVARTPEARAAKRKQALDEFMAASSGLNAYVNPKVIKQFAKYVYTLIEDGARSVDDIVAAAAKDGVKADQEDVYAAFRSQVKESTLSDLQKEVAKTKRELKAAANYTEGDEAVKGFRKAQKADAPGNEAVKDFKARERTRKNLEEKLKGLEERIANKDYAEVSIVRQARRTDAEINKLRQKIRIKDEMVKAGVEDMRPRTAADHVGTYLNEIKLWNLGSRAADLTANAVKFADFAKSTGTRRVVDLATSKYLDDIPLTKGTNADRTARIFNNAKERLKADAELIWKGGDGDSVKKYGSSWIGGKAAGLTDVPFKSFYYDWMADLAADVKARKKLGNGADDAAVATEREAILASLDEHPDIQLMAEEYALNQTLNNPNWASKTTGFWRREAEKSGKIAPILVDEFLGRFSKVITNVAIDAVDRTPVGILRGGAKLKRAKSLGQELTTSERAIINDMITKGFTGIPTALAGYYLGDKVIGTIKGERNKYIDYGDAEKIGGPMSIFLLGATLRKAESIKDPNEAFKLKAGTIARLPLNTPLASNAKDVLDLFTEFDAKSASKYAARKVTGFLPWMSQSRDIAERMDAKGAFGLKTGAEVERDKMPKEISTKTGNEIQTSNFLKILEADFMSRTPGLRQRLPIKKSDADKKTEKATTTKKKKEVKIEDLLR